MQRPLYPCTGGTLVYQCSVIQPPVVSYPLMLPVTTPLLFWNAKPVMPYMYQGGVTYQPHYCWPVGVPHQIPDTKYFVASFLVWEHLFKKKKERRKFRAFSTWIHQWLIASQLSSNWWTLSADRLLDFSTQLTVLEMGPIKPILGFRCFRECRYRTRCYEVCSFAKFSVTNCQGDILF